MTVSSSPALNVTPVLPVPNLDEAVQFWTVALGVAPTFVDGTRWAQFDLAGRRLALSSEDGGAQHAGVIVKVSDLRAAREQLRDAGVDVGPIEAGQHEARCSATAPGGWSLMLYSALDSGPAQDEHGES